MGFFWAVFCVISWLVLGPRMRRQTALLGSMTIPDYFFFRYRSDLAPTIHLLSAIIILFATLWYMVGITKGLGHVMSSVLDIPYTWGTLAVIFFTCAYTIWGGLVTFGALVSFFYILGIGLAVGMKQIAEPRCLIRFYSIDNASSMRFAMIWTPVFLGISLICVMGLGSLVHGMATPEEAAYLIHHTDEVVGFMLSKFDNAYISGICIAGLFAAGMSSLASVMLIVGTAFVRDMWHVLQPMQEERVVPRTRWTIFCYCVLLYVVTLYPPAGIVEMTAFSGAVFAASFFPAIFGGLYLRWGTDVGALLSMLTGILSCIVWRFGFRFEYEGLSDIHEVIPAFSLSVVVYLVISRLTCARMPESTHLDRLFA